MGIMFARTLFNSTGIEELPASEASFEPLNHHEDSETFQNIFSKDVFRLKSSILTNPFKLHHLTVLNNENACFDESVYKDLASCIYLMTRLQYQQTPKAKNLNKYLAEKFLKLHGNAVQILCITFNDTVISNYENVLTENLINICKVEEASSHL